MVFPAARMSKGQHGKIGQRPEEAIIRNERVMISLERIRRRRRIHARPAHFYRVVRDGGHAVVAVDEAQYRDGQAMNYDGGQDKEVDN